MSIGYNWEFSPDRAIRALAAIDNPSTAVWLGDTVSADAAAGGRGYEFSGNSTTRVCGDNEWFDARHNNGANLGFVDGHVKWYSRSTIDGRKGIQTAWPM